MLINIRLKAYLLLFYLLVLNVSATDKVWLNDKLLVYDAETNTYRPYHTNDATTDTYYLMLDKSYSNSEIRIYSDKSIKVFINHQLYKTANDSIWLPYNKLANFGDSVKLLTIRTSGTHLRVALGNIMANTFERITETTESGPAFETLLRQLHQKRNAYICGLLFIILVLVLLKRVVNNFFARFIQIAIESIPKERETEKKKILNTENLAIYLVGVTLLLILVVVFGKNLKESIQSNPNSFVSVLALFFIFTISFLIVKIGMHLCLNRLYMVKNFSRYLIYNLIVIIILGLILTIPVYFIILSPYPILKFDFNISFTIAISIAFVLWITKEFIDYLRFFGFQKMYLITYICISDVFPFLILLKISNELIS